MPTLHQSMSTEDDKEEFGYTLRLTFKQVAPILKIDSLITAISMTWVPRLYSRDWAHVCQANFARRDDLCTSGDSASSVTIG